MKSGSQGFEGLTPRKSSHLEKTDAHADGKPEVLVNGCRFRWADEEGKASYMCLGMRSPPHESIFAQMGWKMDCFSTFSSPFFEMDCKLIEISLNQFYGKP